MHKHDGDVRKLEIGLPYLVKHNQEHVKDIEKWIQRAKDGHQDEVADDLQKVLELSRMITDHLKSALNNMEV